MTDFTYNNKFIDAYKILGLSFADKPSNKEIKQKYRELIRLAHPDFNPNNPEKAHELSNVINLSYSFLTELRQEYDAIYRSHVSEIKTSLSPTESGDSSSIPPNINAETNKKYPDGSRVFSGNYKNCQFGNSCDVRTKGVFYNCTFGSGCHFLNATFHNCTFGDSCVIFSGNKFFNCSFGKNCENLVQSSFSNCAVSLPAKGFPSAPPRMPPR